VALRRPKTKRSYPTPITNFDDSNRESYIAKSSGIGSLKPMDTIVDYNLGKGGRDPSMIGGFGLGPSGLMDPVVEVPTGGPVGMFGEDRSDTTLDMLLDDVLDKQYKPIPATEQGLQEMAMDDTYTLPNLLQMLNDARDAGNVDEIELLTNDLEMMYPGATMDVAELSDSQLDFINSQMGTPDFYSNYQDYKDAVDAREEKPLFGIFGGQEPATDSEIINKLKETYGTLPFQVPAIV
jgi:hypothetical protein